MYADLSSFCLPMEPSVPREGRVAYLVDKFREMSSHAGPRPSCSSVPGVGLTEGSVLLCFYSVLGFTEAAPGRPK